MLQKKWDANLYSVVHFIELVFNCALFQPQFLEIRKNDMCNFDIVTKMAYHLQAHGGHLEIWSISLLLLYLYGMIVVRSYN